jgi:glycosyltransferase involved in cell wall biosynthesis
MKILFISSWYPSRQNRNDGVFVREHAKSVRAAGDEVVVLHVAPAPPEGKGRWELERETDPALTEGIPTWHLRVRPFGSSLRPSWLFARLAFWATSAYTSWSVVRAVRRIRGTGFRPVVLHSNVFTAGTAAVIAGRLFRLPVVATEHYTGFGRRTLAAGEVKRARFALGRMACVMPVCAYLRRAIEAYGIRGRFEIVPNAVDTELFFPPAPGTLPGSPVRLLFVGGLEPTGAKGFPTLVDALARLRRRRTDWRLDVIGDGPSRPDSERLIAEAGLSEVVTFHGLRPKTSVAETMRSSDVFVLSSRFENLPCVVIEAMASGLPLVATRVGGVPEMVGEGDGLLVEPDDAQALADGIELVLAGLPSCDRAAISERAVARYSLPVVGAMFHRVYGSVVPRPAAR